MALSRSQRAALAVAGAAAAAAAVAALSSASAHPPGSAGARQDSARQPGAGGAGPANPVLAASPACAWPVASTAQSDNVDAPDPSTAYWLTPFAASPGESITIAGKFPTSRFMSFAVYNDAFQLFSNTVNGQRVPSDLSGNQITPDKGTTNPWHTGRVRKGQRFTVRLLPTATAAQQRAENAIPVIDEHPPATPSGPKNMDYVIFRTYLPAGGSAAVDLPAITLTQHGRSTTLTTCGGGGAATDENASLVNTGSVLSALRDDGVAMSCTSRCAAPALQYFGPSADSEAGVFPDPLSDYLEMAFTPKPGYVVVTHGLAPTSPVSAGHGTPGDSVGAHPVSWTKPRYQVLYWSISNYVSQQPYPAVETGRGATARFGAAPDYRAKLSQGYYTVVSSLPSDKPSAASLKADGATWIPTSASHPQTAEFQLLRNVLAQKPLYPQGFAFIRPPANPSDIIPPATVKKQMGAYYPQAAQCPVRTFETGGWAGCLAATRG